MKIVLIGLMLYLGWYNISTALPSLQPITTVTRGIPVIPSQYQGTFSNMYNLSGYVPNNPNINGFPIDQAYGNQSVIITANEPNGALSSFGDQANNTLYTHPARVMVPNIYKNPDFKPHGFNKILTQPETDVVPPPDYVTP